MSLYILRPGLLTTVQDLGRFGYQQDGIIVSGAMDAVALRVANLLVGNPETAAGLEITLLGPRIRFETDHLIALTGAHLSPTLNGQPVGQNRAVWVAAGTELAFGRPWRGAGPTWPWRAAWRCRRCWAAAAPTCAPALGGTKAGRCGPAIRCPWANLRLLVQSCYSHSCGLRRLGPQLVLRPAPPCARLPRHRPVLRAVRGPEYAQFSAESQRAFWEQPFTITPEADRMGYRLQGPALARPIEAELLSSAVTFGTVQVPAGGQPIVLLADHQTTGGYPRLAQVISADFGVLAQAAAGAAAAVSGGVAGRSAGAVPCAGNPAAGVAGGYSRPRQPHPLTPSPKKRGHRSCY